MCRGTCCRLSPRLCGFLATSTVLRNRKKLPFTPGAMFTCMPHAACLTLRGVFDVREKSMFRYFKNRCFGAGVQLGRLGIGLFTGFPGSRRGALPSRGGVMCEWWLAL